MSDDDKIFLLNESSDISSENISVIEDVSYPSDEYLDNLVLSHFKKVEYVLQLTSVLEGSLKTGRFLLAKTRCSSTNGRVISSQSFNVSEMEQYGATARVDHFSSPAQNSSDEIAHEKFHLTDNLKPSMDDPKADPIRWFGGVLVPTSLRQSQDCFRRSIHVSIELATKRAELSESTKLIRQMIKRRQEMDKIKELHP